MSYLYFPWKQPNSSGNNIVLAFSFGFDDTLDDIWKIFLL